MVLGRNVPYIPASVLLSLGPVKSLFAAPCLGVGPRDWGSPGAQRQDRHSPACSSPQCALTGIFCSWAAQSQLWEYHPRWFLEEWVGAKRVRLVCDEHFSLQNLPRPVGKTLLPEMVHFTALSTPCKGFALLQAAVGKPQESPWDGAVLALSQHTLRQELALDASRVIQGCVVPKMLPEQILPLRASEHGAFCGTDGWMEFVSYGKTGLKLHLRLWKKNQSRARIALLHAGMVQSWKPSFKKGWTRVPWKKLES